jgi:hypothetical protein
MCWFAHFISEQGDLMAIPLAIKEIQGHHDKDTLGKASMEVILEWLFGERIGFWVMDGAFVNDAMLRVIAVCKLRLLSCALIGGNISPPACCG